MPRIAVKVPSGSKPGKSKVKVPTGDGGFVVVVIPEHAKIGKTFDVVLPENYNIKGTSLDSGARPAAPKGKGHHYHKHKDHTPAAHNASIFVLPDLAFAIVFLGAVAMQLAFCWTYGYDSTQDGTTEETEGRSTFEAIVAGGMSFSVLASFVYIKLLVKCGTGIIKCLVFTCVGLMLGVALLCVAYGLPMLAIPFGVVGGLALIYFCCFFGHLEFAGACLEVSAAVIARHPAVEAIALGMIAAQAAWSMVFSTALVGLQVGSVGGGGWAQAYTGKARATPRAN